MFGNPSATIIFPAELNSMNPIEVSDPVTSLEAAFVERYAIESLSTQWKRDDLCGVFILLSEHVFTNAFRAYVGKTTHGFEQVLQERNERAAFWSNAILFSNHDGENLTPAAVDALADEITMHLNCGNHIKLENDLSTGPITLPQDVEPVEIDDMTLFAIRVMFLQGYRSASLAKAVRDIEQQSKLVHPVD